MARALSQDLRDRVIDATLAGMSARGAAARFGVGVSTAVAWAGRARQGDRQAHPQGQKRSSKLDAHRPFLLGLIAEKDDITLAEMRARLKAERGVHAGIGTLWAWLDRAGQTFKKRQATLPNRTARMS
jgi:transposase